MYMFLIYTLCSVYRIYPTEHFKEKYAVHEVYYTSDVSVCVVCVHVCVLSCPPGMIPFPVSLQIADVLSLMKPQTLLTLV